MIKAVASELAPKQFGVSTPLGSERMVHAVRDFIERHPHGDNILIKLYLSNIFNPVSREPVLELCERQATQHLPAARPLINLVYAQPTPHSTAGNVTWSCRGVQQGDPLGSLLFALVIDPIVQSLHSSLNV